MKRIIIAGLTGVIINAILPNMAGASENIRHDFTISAGLAFAAQFTDHDKTFAGGYTSLAVKNGPLDWVVSVSYLVSNYDNILGSLSVGPYKSWQSMTIVAGSLRYNGRVKGAPWLSPYLFSGIGFGAMRRHNKIYDRESSVSAYDGFFNIGIGACIALGRRYSLEIQGQYPAMVSHGFSTSLGLRIGL